MRLECGEPDLVPHLASLYSALSAEPGLAPDRFRLDRGSDGLWQGESPSGARFEGPDAADVLSWLDDELTIGMQHRRPDLLFVHAAALVRGGRALLLVAESGGGKSTTTWAALHHGFALLSDELAPVDPASLVVHPYPRAVCLKGDAPAGYPLPPGTVRASRTSCIAVRHVPTAAAAPLAALVYVSYQPTDPRPTIREITPAESAARLYANSLNPLAHGGEGLDAMASLAPRVRSFVLRSGDLPATCALLADALDR